MRARKKKYEAIGIAAATAAVSLGWMLFGVSLLARMSPIA